MKFGCSFEGKVEKVGKDGAGLIAREHGKPFSTYGTIPGETIRFFPFKRTPEVIRAKLEEVLVPSPERITPTCPYAGTCGGCKWQHASYDAQREMKLSLLREGFEKFDLACPITEILPAKDLFCYRNRMDFVFGKHGELGLKAPDRWWETLDLETCFLLSPESVEIVNRVRIWARATKLPFWDSKMHAGFFRYLVIREGKNTGERMVTLITAATEDKNALTGFVEAIGDSATSIVWGINPRLTDLSIADEIIPLKGNPWIHEEVNGVRYKITPNAFFQTNTKMAAELQNAVHRACGDLSSKTLLDLYCGSGFFSLPFSKEAKRTIGVELVEEAIVAARENAAANNLTVEYEVSKTETFDWKGTKPDVVIVDPPRAGMHPDAIKDLLEASPPKIVYVSCSFPRFVQEYKEHLSTKYDLTHAEALDLFPHTPHMECVFTLERR